MSLAKLKGKLSQIKELIDEAEEREANANHDLKEAVGNEERNKSEAEGIKRRIKLLKAELFKTLGRFDEQKIRLDTITEKGEQEEIARKELEENEDMGEERMCELEEKIQEAVKNREEKATSLNEASRRLVVLQSDLKCAQEKEQTLLERAKILESTLESCSDRARHLEERDEEASEREQESEEKVTFLEGILKEMIVRAEGAERDASNLERLQASIEDEINSFTEKKQQLRKEMESITDMVDEI